MATYRTESFSVVKNGGFEMVEKHKYVFNDKINNKIEIGTFRVRGGDEAVLSIKSMPKAVKKEFPLGVIIDGKMIEMPVGEALDPTEMVLYTSEGKEFDFRQYAADMQKYM